MNKNLLRLAGGGLIVLGVLLLVCGIEFLLSPNVYEATVRLKMEKDQPDVSIHETIRFDPYWIQDQFETIQSKMILFRVITNLSLTRIWAARLKKSEPLRIEEAYARLRNKVDVGQYRSTSVIEVKIGSEDPIEAAAIANEIAEVYVGHRAEQRRETRKQQILSLEAESEKLNRAITNKQAAIQANEAFEASSETDSLDDLKQQLEALRKRMLLAKPDRRVPINPPVEIIDRAEPPLRPRYPRKGVAAAASIFGGLVAIALGMTMLRRTQKGELGG